MPTKTVVTTSPKIDVPRLSDDQIAEAAITLRNDYYEANGTDGKVSFPVNYLVWEYLTAVIASRST
jgi:hypothetical protein